MQIGHALPIASMGPSRVAVDPETDEALIQSIARGDKRARRVLYARNSTPVYRFLLRYVRDESVAEDLVSEVFLAAWRQASKFEGRSTLSTWLLAIARYQALSALRERRTEPLDDEAAALVEDPADDPEIALHKRQQSSMLSRSVTQLSTAHREIIDLVYYHETSIQDAAKIIGVSPNTVKTRMFHARNRLAQLAAASGLDRGMRQG